MILDHAGFCYRRCETIAEKARCRDLSLEVMLTPEYGLMDRSGITPETVDVERCTYIAITAGRSEDLVAASRLDFRYDLSKFDNVSVDALERSRSDRVVGAAHFPTPFLGVLQRVECFVGTWTIGLACFEEAGVDTVYIVAREDDRKSYESLGWIIAGGRFVVPGWRHHWWPMMMCLDKILPCVSDPGFPDRWLRETGNRFNHAFWRKALALSRDVRMTPVEACGERDTRRDLLAFS